ncbi:MATE family efflux transporter [Paraliomyxa miuraensis]|uniref:MATE family efflux transporter n=1 Tax=Paraliomyxa miuraensis TaxID=376150 RepID=UPI0022573EA4|nr:MATE family efflux transporter [Paraliomyxa miuraensis]MCX4246917.1 MATE family efflux transporter [Paraliomyxa miuraensis]
MTEPIPRIVELRELLRLGLPVAVTQLGMMMLGVVDTMMVGHLGTTALDAAALGSLWTYGTAVFGIGVVMGMDPVVSQAHGAGNHRRVALTLHRGVVVSLLVTPPLALCWWLTTSGLLALGQAPELAAAAGDYVGIQIFGLWPMLGFYALRQYLQGRGVVFPGVAAVLLANVFNVVANWALIFGNLGLPAMGLAGAGLATGLTRCVLLLSLVLWTWGAGLFRDAWERPSTEALHLRGLAEILRHGIPIGLQYGLEMWAFQFSTLMAGTMGEAELAAHVIALNLASLSFMVPMGISQGASARVGNLLGAGRSDAARRSATLALMLGGGVMVVGATAFVVLREQLPRLYTSDPAVIGLAASILPIAAAFQLFDGTQAVGGGVLRGLGATRPAAVFNFVGYYLVALPLAAFAAAEGWGLQGVWWGLCLGLFVVASALVWWIRRMANFERPGAGHPG